MFRLYWRRWRLAVVAVVAGIGSTAGILALVGWLGRAQPGSAAAISYQPSAHSRFPRGTQPRALALLNQAAVACQQLAYHGIQVTTWRTDGSESRYLITLWHRPGSSAIAASTAVYDGTGGALENVTADASDSDALFISPVMLGLMEANFAIRYGGQGIADSRSADVVELVRPRGPIAARIWLDRQTMLPLRRLLYDSSGAVVAEDAVIDLDLGRKLLGSPPAVAVQPSGIASSRVRIGALQRQGWPLPDSLGGGLTVVAASRSADGAEPLVDVSYSDGLSVVSVFVQRGVLPAQLEGWRVVLVDGDPVFAGSPAERTFTWSAGGFVYTVLASAPPQTVRQAVSELPHDRVPGFLQRVGRGLKRIASWVDPFG